MNVAIACVAGLLALMKLPRTDLPETLVSMPEPQALLKPERGAVDAEREASWSATLRRSALEPGEGRDDRCASHKRLRQEPELFNRRRFIGKADRADKDASAASSCLRVLSALA